MNYQPGKLSLLDQRKLPSQEIWLDCTHLEQVAKAIETMVVRGAPAIGCAAAYALLLDARNATCKNWSAYEPRFELACDRLAKTRPTAINLFYAIDKAKELVSTLDDGLSMDSACEKLERYANAVFQQDVATCQEIGKQGAALAEEGQKLRILTHCNTGSLATAGYGTALGVIRACHESGVLDHVFVDETRPWLQGARLTAFELQKEGIDHTLIVEGSAAYLMAMGKVDWVVVGADRIAANGDTANKIGTYSLAVLAKYHKLKFFVAAPLSSFDVNIQSGREIPIEQRSGDEITHIAGKLIAPEGCKGLNLAFDVTPESLIDGIITEVGIIKAPFKESIAKAIK